MASAIPHRAGNTKKTARLSGWGLQNRRAMIQAKLARAAENRRINVSTSLTHYIVWFGLCVIMD